VTDFIFCALLINLHKVAQRIEQFDAPEDVFQAIVGNAVRLNGNGSNAEDILHEFNTMRI
jgi:hypothetical protein